MAGYGAPKGNKFNESHGIISLRNQITRRKRKGRGVIDHRSVAGRHAERLRHELIQDQGGIEQLSAAKLALIEIVTRDTYYLDEVDRRINNAMIKANQMTPPRSVKSPKAIWILYSYRAPIVRNLSQNLLALGLEKPPAKVKSLDEILAESDGEQEP